MDLYSNDKGSLKRIDPKPFKLEKDIQSMVEANSKEIFDLQFVSTEFHIDSFYLDSVFFDEENKSFVVVEYKKTKSFSVIDQGYTYLSLMLNNKSDFILEYNEKYPEDALKKKDVDWSQSRVIFISTGYTTYQINSVNFKDVPFELWEIKQYGNNTIGLSHITPTSKESIQSVGTSGNSLVKTVANEVKVYSESDLLRKCSESTLALWSDLQNRFNELDNINYVTRKHYIGIRKGKKTVTYVHFYKSKLLLHMVRGNIYKGKKSKAFFTLDDSKNLAKMGDHNFKDGTVRKYYEMNIQNVDDTDYIMILCKQKYHSI